MTPSGTGKPRTIGIIGGTFDPVHNGHLAIAEEARTQLGLDEVLFVPAGQPWMKPERQISPALHRLAMVWLAIQGKPHMSLSTVETDHPGPSYTVETLRKLREEVGREAELYFIIGWDALPELPRWVQPEEIIKLCVLVALPRPGFPRPDIAEIEKKLPGISERVILLDRPHMDISATEIRERVGKGLDISHLVPVGVGRYIREKGLYRG